MLVRLYPDLLWDILSWLGAEDVVRLRMVRPGRSVYHLNICDKCRLVNLSASKRTNVSCSLDPYDLQPLQPQLGHCIPRGVPVRNDHAGLPMKGEPHKLSCAHDLLAFIPSY